MDRVVLQRAARRTRRSVAYAESSEGSLVFPRTAGDAALLPAGGCGSTGAGIGRHGADRDSVFQGQHRSGRAVLERPDKTLADLLRGRDPIVPIFTFLQSLRGLSPHIDYGWADAVRGPEFSAIAVGVPAISGGEAAVILGHDLVPIRTDRADCDWDIFPRARMVLCLALAGFIEMIIKVRRS